MLKDRGVRSTGKDNVGDPRVNGAGMCGPDYHYMKARMRIRAMQESYRNNPDGPFVLPSSEDHRHLSKIESRKHRGSASFSPGDGC
jgi:hypothetical protein